MRNAGDKNTFVMRMEADLVASVSHNKTSVEKIALGFGLKDKNLIKELTELAIVNVARSISLNPDLSVYERYQEIVQLYEKQVNLSHRTSQSMLLQQYSTPAPIGFIGGIFCGMDRPGTYFEPSAGNGLLTIASDPKNFYVNEIDEVRRDNLKTQGYAGVFDQDATLDFRSGNYRSFFENVHFEGIITNPPFGTLDRAVKIDGTPINTLDHLMVINALDLMSDTGRAAVIIGGHTVWDRKGRVQSGKNRIFLNFLHKHYNVLDSLNINGKKLYSRQGTSFNVRLILIAGRKAVPQGVAPLFNPLTDIQISDFDTLYNRVTKFVDTMQTNDTGSLNVAEAEAEALELEMDMLDLGSPYIPASDACVNLNTEVPDSLEYETQIALYKIKQEVGGDITGYVRKKLKYKTEIELCKALAAEQIDAVAMAIYNIEKKKQGMIIGDQTGIGKGRIAAAMIRYGHNEGIQPIFMTEKPNLFSDIYRDLVAIGSSELVPFIVNGRESKTDIKDKNGNVVHQALHKEEQEAIFKKGKVPKTYHFICCTYSQFNSPGTKPTKPMFLEAITKDNILVMDESHNASGTSNTGEFLQKIVDNTRGIVFLSATFAKRPDNMPIYAMKTAISEANMSKEELVLAIMNGGVALQEILSAQLVREGQMLRRERTFEGIEVNYITLDELEVEHRAIADKVTEILRHIISFQKEEIDPVIDELDSIMAAEQKEVIERQGTSEAGISNQPYFSKVFNVINQMLFAIKSEAVADRAIARLREGMKPVIAFSSTMGSFLEEMTNTDGLPLSNGDTLNADFSEVLMRGLDGILRYSEKDPETGELTHKKFELTELPPNARARYLEIARIIKNVSTGITISPIDLIVQKITKAGFTVAEVTGRKLEVQLNLKNMQGVVLARKKINVNDAFRQFNDNEVDCLLINQSGSTGASAHAIPTDKVPASKMKQRVMIVLQAELDINREVQKRGRVNRTGQILKPIYDYVSSAIPAEKRLSMMLQKKLKSLDANTASNQKQSNKVLDVEDFLNKYGDKVVKEYLKENPKVNELLNDPLGLNKAEEDKSNDRPAEENAAHRVSGRVAVLSTEMQAAFYDDVSKRYKDYESYLKQRGEYDLEVEAMNLEAETIDTMVIKSGKGGSSSFSDDSILETVMANVLKKPMTKDELLKQLEINLDGRTPEEIQRELVESFTKSHATKLQDEYNDIERKYTGLIANIPNEKKIKEIANDGARSMAIEQRKVELEAAKETQIKVITLKFENIAGYILGIFNFFKLGRVVNYPINSYANGHHHVKSVFLGFKIDYKRPNPFARSAIRLDFALSDSNRFLGIPASYDKDVESIKGASYTIDEDSGKDTIENWDVISKASTQNRKERNIITGNILQAFGTMKGKLISYTTNTPGEIKKGILMPDDWEVPQAVISTVNVPIIKALKMIKSILPGNSLQIGDKMSIGKTYRDTFMLMVPSAKSSGGSIYLDKDILDLVIDKNFNRTSGYMRGEIEEKNITELVNILQYKFSMNVSISRNQYDLMAESMPVRERDEVPEGFQLPKKVVAAEQDEFELQLQEAEAEAIILELEMLEAELV